MNFRDDLRELWRCEETSGTRFGAYGNVNLTETAGTVNSTTGKVETNAISLPTSYRNFDMPNSELSGVDSFSISLWINMNSSSTTTTPRIFDFGLNTTQRLTWGPRLGSSAFSNRQAYLHGLSTGPTRNFFWEPVGIAPRADIWNLFSLSISPTYALMMCSNIIDGHLSASISNASMGGFKYSNIVSPTTHRFFGNFFNTTEYLVGSVDHIVFWKRPIGLYEHIALWNNNSGLIKSSIDSEPDIACKSYTSASYNRSLIVLENQILTLRSNTTVLGPQVWPMQ